MKNKYVEELRAEAGLEEEEDIPEENLLPVSPETEQKTVRKTMKTVFFFMGVLLVLEAAVVLFLLYGPINDWSHGKWQALAGLLVGGILGALWFWSLSRQIRGTLELPEQQAKNRMRLGAILRYVLLAALIAAAFITKILNPLLILIGVLNLKPAAFFSGLLNKKHA